MLKLSAREKLKRLDTRGLSKKEIAQRIGVCDQRLYQITNGVKPNPKTPLTKRKIEILKMIADGKRNSEIAAVLGISVKTVQGHRGAIFAKLKAHNVAEVIKAGVRMGLVKL